MDCGRRSRRGNRRNNSCKRPCGPSSCGVSPCNAKSRSFLSGFCNFLIMSALMALIYLMLEYHCTTCNAKCSLNCVTKNIDDITNNLSYLKKSYHDLEIQITKFSQELPRLEGQIEILETLTHTLDRNDFGMGWNPRSPLTLPNVDVYLAKTGCSGKNVSHLVKTANYIDCCRNNTCLRSKLLERPIRPKNVVYCAQ